MLLVPKCLPLNRIYRMDESINTSNRARSLLGYNTVL